MFISCLSNALMVSSSGRIQCFYSVLLILFCAFSLLDMWWLMVLCGCGYQLATRIANRIPVVPVCFSVTRYTYKWRWVIRLKANSIRFGRISIRFNSLLLHHSGLRPFMNCGLSALSNVLAKLLTVISLGLAVNAQWRKHESKKAFH